MLHHGRDEDQAPEERQRPHLRLLSLHEEAGRVFPAVRQRGSPCVPVIGNHQAVRPSVRMGGGAFRDGGQGRAGSLQSSAAASQAMRDDIAAISDKLKRLHRLYLDEDIEREAFLAEKADLLSRKKSLEEEMAGLQKGRIAWLEPLRGWIKDAENLTEFGRNRPSPRQKILRAKNLRLEPLSQKSYSRFYPHPTIRFAPRSAAKFF